jgi:hypothetical protein
MDQGALSFQDGTGITPEARSSRHNESSDEEREDDDEDVVLEDVEANLEMIRRGYRESSRGSLVRRTYSERGDSDDSVDVNEVVSDARRMRRRLHRSSLVFNDLPPLRVDELEEPDTRSIAGTVGDSDNPSFDGTNPKGGGTIWVSGNQNLTVGDINVNDGGTISVTGNQKLTVDGIEINVNDGEIINERGVRKQEITTSTGRFQIFAQPTS